MNDIPGLNFLPEKYRAWVLFAIATSPYITRAYHSITQGGGFKSILSAIWLGTNTPKGTVIITETDNTKS